LYWGAIFPLGMYAACTWQMNRAMGFDFLGFLPPAFLAVALLGWLLTFTAMIRRLLRLARGIAASVVLLACWRPWGALFEIAREIV